MINNGYHNKSWSTGALQIHVDPPMTPLIKSNLDLKTRGYYLKIKLRTNPTSEKSDMYEF